MICGNMTILVLALLILGVMAGQILLGYVLRRKTPAVPNVDKEKCALCGYVAPRIVRPAYHFQEITIGTHGGLIARKEIWPARTAICTGHYIRDKVHGIHRAEPGEFLPPAETHRPRGMKRGEKL